jgi:hypothetical protein
VCKGKVISKTSLELVDYYCGCRKTDPRWLPCSTDHSTPQIIQLHFGKKQRGKLPDSTKVFKGSFGELDNCVPKN